MDSVGGASGDSAIFVNVEHLIVRLTGFIDLSLASFNDIYDTIALEDAVGLCPFTPALSGWGFFLAPSLPEGKCPGNTPRAA